MSAAVDSRDFYRRSLAGMQAGMYGGGSALLVQVILGGQAYSFQLWTGQQLPDQLLAYDTETALIQGREIPPLALTTVFGSEGSAYLIHPARLPQFIQQHVQAYFCTHNATFDFWTTAQHLQADPAALLSWWGIVGDGRLYCTMLGDELIRLGQIDAEPIARGLDVVAQEYCGLELDKSDPFRLRYGELLGLSEAAWAGVDPGFWQYATKDPIATLQVAQAQFKIAQRLIDSHRAELLPDAVRKYGPLTCCLQVQGAIALDYASRVGVSVDVQHAQELRQEIYGNVQQAMQELEQLAGGAAIFKRYKRTGKYQLTPAGVAKRNAKIVKQQLELIARSADEPIRPPRIKNGTVTDAAKYWADFCDLNPFVAAYVEFSEQAKLLQFFSALDQPRIYPRYHPLVRTGRSSCSDPNLQQLPRQSRFREMIVAPPGYQLLQIDYSAIELRTLAAICLQRYGRSKLAELFQAGIDPHKYTAALLLGLTAERFSELPAADQKQARQRAKAVNFGVPGGLGAASLVSYAKRSYGVELTLEQAQQFRERLITQVYPELSAFLADQSWLDLVANLGCTEATVRQAFGNAWQIREACRIIAGETATARGDEYTQELIAHVWTVLQQLNRCADLQAELQAQPPSLELSRRIFWGSSCTLTGRLRGHVGYTQRANSPFQGLAADGNKLALFRLLRAGFQVCGFIHDEVLILLPDGSDYDAAVQQVQQILADAMQELCPGVPICTEYLLADKWYKGQDDQPRTADGRIVPYRKPVDPQRPAAEQPQQMAPCPWCGCTYPHDLDGCDAAPAGAADPLQPEQADARVGSAATLTTQEQPATAAADPPQAVARDPGHVEQLEQPVDAAADPPKVANIRDLPQGWQADPRYVYIGRGQRGLKLPRSPYANPFTIGRDGRRAGVVAKYRAWLAEQPELIAQARAELPGKVLVCHCRPAGCHGDVLVELLGVSAQAAAQGTADGPQSVASEQSDSSRQRQPVYDPQSIWSFVRPSDLPAAGSELFTSTVPPESEAITSSPQPARAAQRQLTQPIKWHGGKHYLAKQIVALMPAHVHYVEPFAGGLSVLLQKDPQGVSEVVNDLSWELTTFWRVLQQPAQFEQFSRCVQAVPFSQVEFLDSTDVGSTDPVAAAVQFFVRCRQSRQGLSRDFATLSRNRTRRGMNEQASSWLSAVEGLPDVHERLQRVVICNQDALQLIRQQDGLQTLFYCDPPYLHDTRASTGEYGAHEMTAEQHEQLLDVLAAIQGKFLLSGYPSQLYASWAQQHGYRCVQFQIDNKASSSKVKQIKTECVWMNYDVTGLAVSGRSVS